MSLDCSKTLDYAKGFAKMCEALYGACESCPLGRMYCGAESITQEHIDIVQAWNDEHREKTNAEVLQELFPKADVFNLCPNRLFRYRDSLECDRTDCRGCKQDFWDAPHKETEAVLHKEGL